MVVLINVAFSAIAGSLEQDERPMEVAPQQFSGAAAAGARRSAATVPEASGGADPLQQR
ncbi:MAG TPA: hypothetical protein PK440_20480 [Candidatus Accumulibacter phosphatis]|nr:hypothetical protein [Candidatus Accumulibacter phosphatis]HRQ97338.1 hypothetical protein [Candidatus Accumulibacter phosphatis]